MTGSSASAASGSGAASAVSAVEIAAELQRQVGEFLSLYGGGRFDRVIQSIVVNVGGQDLVSHYGVDSGPAVAHNGYSVTKSVMSMLVGIAIGEGRIRSVDATLSELLPQYARQMAPGVGQVTLEQVLTMTGGLAADERTPRYHPGVDWTALTVSTDLWQPPGEGFVYSSPGSHLLSAILVRATNMSVLDYARAKLFDPLGISTHPADEPVVLVPDLSEYDARPGFGWSTDPQGLHLGFSDLKITSPDMIQLGRLYLQEGRWNGRQLVPAQWVRDSTRSHVTAEEGPDGPVGYGYQWWIDSPNGHPSFGAGGYAGQVIEVIPDLDLVVAVSSTNVPDHPEPGELFQQLIVERLVPTLTG
ncbi:serine hydrolase domain-containing protein [Nakamurella sp. GG22]